MLVHILLQAETVKHEGQPTRRHGEIPGQVSVALQVHLLQEESHGCCEVSDVLKLVLDVCHDVVPAEQCWVLLL